MRRILPAVAADAKAPSCTRGGATLEEASGNVRVVRRELKRMLTSAFPRSPAVAGRPDAYLDRFHWTVGEDTIKSLDLR